MDIYVYKGEWNLASIDLECLCTLMYIKVSKAPVTIKTGSSTFWSPNGLLPYLVAEDGNKIAGFRDITAHLARKGYEIPASENQFDDSYVAVLRQNLLPYFLYNLWCPQNLDHSRALYANRIPFPLSFVSPDKYVRRADEMMQTLYGFSLKDNVEKHDFAEMALKAKTVLNDLETRLEAQEYAAAKGPGLLDVHVYAYAALILHNALPNNALQSHIQQCPNIVRYVQRITKKFFENDGFISETKEKPKTEEKKAQPGETSDDGDSPSARRKRYFFSGIVAVVSMITFAVVKGILHISYADDGQEYIDYVLDSETGGGDDDEED